MNCLMYSVTGIIIALFVLTYNYMKWSFQYWKRKNIPFIEPNILFGNIENPFRNKSSIGDNVRQLYNQAREKGWEYVGIYMFLRPIFMPVNLDVIKEIMAKNFKNFSDRGIYVNEEDEPITAHVLAIGGTKWRNLRTKFTPTLTSCKLKTLFPTLADCGIELEKFIDETISINKNPIDIKTVLVCYSIDVIGSCAFGLDCNSFKEPESPFRQFGTKIFQPTKLNLMKIAVANTYPKLAEKLHLTLIPKDVTRFFTNIVRKTVEYRETNEMEGKDFLQMLIDIKNHKEVVDSEQTDDVTTLSMDEMVAQSFVFFVAGFETSSTTMTFTLFELALNQDVQNKVRQEIERVFKKHGNQITYDSLNDLTYMEQVISETLRKYPPIPVITRRCVEDYKLLGSEIIIKKNMGVFIPVKGLHYDEEYYPNPEIFDPERFNKENKQTIPPYAYIPFGEGPRICLGMRFGMIQSKIGLVSVLRNHRVTLNKLTEVPLKMAVNSLTPDITGGLWLNIQKV